jgi:hypothetical protein
MLPHLSLLLLKWEELGRGGDGETSPDPRCLSASFPASSVILRCVVITLSERDTRASVLATEQREATA